MWLFLGIMLMLGVGTAVASAIAGWAAKRGPGLRNLITLVLASLSSSSALGKSDPVVFS
jgi:hypothetical protein